MNSGEKESQDDRLAEYLIAYDESLRGAASARTTDLPPIEADHELAKRLRESKECLELLARVRRFETQTGVGTTGNRGKPPDCPAPADGFQSAALGRFQIVRELGRGGLGVVLLAIDPQLHRRVALKIPRSDVIATDESRRRFLREAEAAARLSHPNIVALYEVSDDGPFCYLVSEYCEGPTMAEWLQDRRTPVPIRQAAILIKQLSDAVQHAHSHGVLHRDLKPSNVLLRLQDSESDEGQRSLDQGQRSLSVWPKLTDFGLARILESAVDETRTGVILGTPVYMAPEQLEGRSSELDARADIYSLGAILYELLTGAAPFRGSSDIDTLRQLVVNEPVAPRRRRQEVPRDLEAICLKCLNRDRAGRYKMAQELADDLERFLAGRPTEARPLSTIGELWKWARRRPAIAALLSLLVMSAITFFGVVVGYNARLRDEIAQADEARRAAERAAETSRRLLYSADVRIASESLRANNVSQALAALRRQVPKPGEKDLREFSWHYLNEQCKPDALSLSGHADTVFAIVFSPDGTRLATASKDGTARLWNSNNGQPLYVLRGHAGEVTSVAFAPDGAVLATGGEDSTVRLWNTFDGKLIRVLEGHSDHVMAVAFSADGRYLASGSRDGTVCVWHPTTGETAAKLEGEMDVIRGVTFLRQEPLLCACDELGRLCLWNTSDWRRSDSIAVELERFFALAGSARGTSVVAAGRAEKIRIWDIVQGKLAAVESLIGGHSEWIRALALSPSDILASGGADAVIHLWRMDRPKYHRTILGHRGDIWSLAWSPDGSRLASSGNDGARVWTIRNEDATDVFPAASLAEEALDAGFVSDSASLITGTNDGNLVVWKVLKPQSPVKIRAHVSRPSAVRISPDDVFIATYGSDDTVKVWELETLKEILSLSASKSGDALAWAPVRHELAFARDDSIVAILDVDSRNVVRELKVEGVVREVIFAPDGSRLITTSSKALQIWNLADGRLVYSLPTSHSNIAVAPEAGVIAAETGSNVSLIRADEGYSRSTLATAGSDIKGLAIDGTTLAVALENPSVIDLWDTRTSQLLMQLQFDAGQIQSVRFSPDGLHLVATGRDTGDHARIWQWSIRRSR